MKEPSVSIQMKYYDTPNANVDNTDIAAGVVIAPCGTIEPKLFRNSTEVLKEFTETGDITRDVDTTVIHAAAIADIIPVFLKRAYDDGTGSPVRGGVAILVKECTISGVEGITTIPYINDSTGKRVPKSSMTYIDLGISNGSSLDNEDLISIASLVITTSDLSDLEAAGSILMYLDSNNPNSINYLADVMNDEDDKDLMNVIVTTNSREYNYSGSTDPNYLNAYGINQFIENVNDYEGLPFKITIPEVIRNTFVPSESNITRTGVEFGAITVPAASSYTIQDRVAALNQLIDQDDYKLAFLCPFGYANPSYVNTLTLKSLDTWSFVPFGVFTTKNDADAIKTLATGVGSDHCIIMAPHDRNTGLADFAIDLSLEVAYIQTVELNANKMCKFAPVMGSANGSFNISKPSVKLSNSVRQSLLDAKIMSIISKPSQNLNYLNKNQCSAGATILSEEQNMRMACQINRDITELMRPMLGRFNTQETRSLVVSIINTYFKNNILNQVYSIDGYTVICDETNNPAEIRAANKLVIDINVTYLNTIWEVNVYHRALNVAQSA